MICRGRKGIDMNDLISRRAAIDAIDSLYFDTVDDHDRTKERIKRLPSAQPDTSRIENALHGKSAEEQYNFIWRLMHNYGMQFTDTRIAVIEWLRGEQP